MAVIIGRISVFGSLVEARLRDVIASAKGRIACSADRACLAEPTAESPRRCKLGQSDRAPSNPPASGETAAGQRALRLVSRLARGLARAGRSSSCQDPFRDRRILIEKRIARRKHRVHDSSISGLRASPGLRFERDRQLMLSTQTNLRGTSSPEIAGSLSFKGHSTSRTMTAWSARSGKKVDGCRRRMGRFGTVEYDRCNVVILETTSTNTRPPLPGKARPVGWKTCLFSPSVLRTLKSVL